MDGMAILADVFVKKVVGRAGGQVFFTLITARQDSGGLWNAKAGQCRSKL